MSTIETERRLIIGVINKDYFLNNLPVLVYLMQNKIIIYTEYDNDNVELTIYSASFDIVPKNMMPERRELIIKKTKIVGASSNEIHEKYELFWGNDKIGEEYN